MGGNLSDEHLVEKEHYCYERTSFISLEAQNLNGVTRGGSCETLIGTITTEITGISWQTFK